MFSVRIEGDKAVIEGLKDLSDKGIPRAQNRALKRIGVGVFAIAFKFLSGAGAKGVSEKVTSKTGKTYLKYKKQAVLAGGWPVPVRMGWLRRLLSWVAPGETKSVGAFTDMSDHSLVTAGGTFTAGLNEVIIYNPAEYAEPIHEGTGSSAKFGRRPFITGAFEFFNQGDQVVRITEEEIDKEIQK